MYASDCMLIAYVTANWCIQRLIKYFTCALVPFVLIRSEIRFPCPLRKWFEEWICGTMQPLAKKTKSLRRFRSPVYHIQDNTPYTKHTHHYPCRACDFSRQESSNNAARDRTNLITTRRRPLDPAIAQQLLKPRFLRNGNSRDFDNLPCGHGGDILRAALCVWLLVRYLFGPLRS